MKIFFFLIVFLMSVLYGCIGGNTEISKKLDEVYNLLENDEPDSAHTVLMKLKEDTYEMSETEKMRYDVYRVSSMNKMFVSLKDEEVSMQRAVEYYEKHGSPDEKMEACLLMGSVYRDMGDAPQALEWFDKAITHGEKGNNKTQLAKIHGQKADLFIKQRLFEDALMEVNLMKSISQSVGEKSLLVNALSIQSTIEYCMSDFQKSVNTYKEASSILCGSLHDTVRAARIAASSIASYMRMERYSDAEDLFNFYEQHSGLFDEEGNILTGYENYYLDKGDYYVAIGDLQESIRFYNKGGMVQDVNNKCMAFYKLANVYSDMSLSDSVAKYALLACGYSQRYFEELQTNTLQQIEATYNYGRYKQESAEKALEAEKSRNFTYVLLSIFVLSLGAICFTWAIWRQKKKREMEHVLVRLEKAKIDAYRISAERNELKAQLEEKVAMIGELRKRAEIATESNASIMVLQKLQSEVEQLNKDLAIAENNYSRMMNESENILTTLLLKANSGINVNEKEWKRLEEYTKIVYPHFFDNLFSAIPNINQDYVRIAALVKLDFSTNHIASLVCRSVTAVSNARRRMYEKAHNGAVGTAELADEWIKGL